MQSAGYLNFFDGSLLDRGSVGVYWSNTQFDSDYGRYLSISNSGSSYMYGNDKASGFSVRCLSD